MVRNFREVVQFDFEGNKVAEYSSITEASKAVKGQLSNLSAACYDDKLSACGYMWRHKDEVGDATKIKPFTSKIDRMRVSIVQFSKDGKHIVTFKSLQDAERGTGTSSSSISSACRGRYITAGGFIWDYESNLPKGYTKAGYIHPRSSAIRQERRGMKVICRNKDTGRRMIFNSVRKAADYFKVSSYLIKEEAKCNGHHPIFSGYFLRIT